MIFSSILFLFYFLPIVLFTYKRIPPKYKNLFLVFASLFFYAWGEPKYILLMLFSTIADFGIGLLIGHAQNNSQTKTAAFFMICSVFVNLSLLIFFKYSNLFITTANTLTGQSFSLLNITLPIGISFYTFQTMSYSIDVYRRKVKPQRNFIDFAAYVTLFPQLIAGPIVRYETVEKELTARTPKLEQGIELFILGLAQKVLLANNVGLVWKEMLDGNLSALSVASSWLGILCFAFQIYFDFCGYSNMAIGLGLMLGFHFPRNFDKPYISQSITEFWRRWHISLSTWFKEYVYIPLGGNRKGSLLQIRNILIVWLLTGIWHGASWNFLLWGLYFGILLIVEKLWLHKLLDILPSILRHLYAMFCILIGWVLFAFEDFDNIVIFLHSMFGGGRLIDDTFVFFISNNIILLLVCIIFSGNLSIKLHTLLLHFKWAKPILYIMAFLLSIAYIVDSSYNPFLYFRF